MLVSTTELAVKIGDPSCMIFDCRHDLFDAGKGERLYRDGHIHSAIYANMDTDLSGEKTAQMVAILCPRPPHSLRFWRATV